MIYSEDLLSIQKQLIEDLGVYFEKSESMSPLSSRIFALLVLSGEQGCTFEEITEKLNASKSSVSTNLQLLQTSGSVSYFTICGDRKRYFKCDSNQFKNRIDAKIEDWKKEKLLYQKVYNYKEMLLKQNNLYHSEHPNIQFGRHYLNMLQSMIESLTKLKDKMELLK